MPAIDVSGVTLVRRTQEELHYDLKRTFLRLASGRFRKVKRSTVIDGVDVRIERGEKVGIIGSNGSGKSTLLKLIAGVLRPTRGAVRVDGRLAALIEIGVGFDPELSLVDNILYYGVLLGNDEAAVSEHVESILEFAELSDIRDQPTKTLSSGMGARLGFAIATEFRPEILLLDEVLAVGDERFRRKCGARIDRFWDAHSTIVLVSHDLVHVARTCDRVIWLDHGRVLFDGSADEAVQRYLNTVPAATNFRTGEEILALAAEEARGVLIMVGGTDPRDVDLFLIRHGHRWRIQTEGWYAQNGFSSEDILRVDPAIAREIPEGDAVI